MSAIAFAQLKRLLPKNNFIRSVSVMAGGTLLGQAVVVLVSPLLTRLYSPEDFGLLAVYAGVLATLGVVSGLRYQLAIPLPEDDEQAADIAALSGLAVVGMTALTAIVFGIWGTPIMRLLNTPQLIPYLWLLPAGLLALGAYQVLNYWAVRTKAFSAIAKTKLTQSVAMVAVQVGGCMLGPVALLIGQAVGQSAGSASLATRTVGPRQTAFRQVRFGGIRVAANRWRRFPVYSTWSGLFNTAGSQLPPILFAALFSPGVAGIYMLAQRVLNMPMALIGRSVAQVFFVHSADAKREGRLTALVARIHGLLARIAMPPMLLLMLTGPDLFAVVFGDQWREAGEFAQWMAPWLYLTFITSPLTLLTSVLEKQSGGLAFNVTLLIVRIGMIGAGASSGNLMFTVALYALGSAVCYAGLLAWLAAISNNSFIVFVVSSLAAFGVGAITTAPTWICLLLFTDNGVLQWICLTLSILLIILSYVFLYLKIEQNSLI